MLKKDLTIEVVMDRLDSRFNRLINVQRNGLPNVPHKPATATITRSEYETLKTELMELKFKAEMGEDSFDAIYLTQEDLNA